MLAPTTAPVTAKNIGPIYDFSGSCAGCSVFDPPSCANYTMKEFCLNIVFGGMDPG